MIFRAATNVTTSMESKSSNVLHHNPTSGVQSKSKMHTYRHPTLRQAAGQGRFVYKPKQPLPLPLNKSEHGVSSALPMAAASPQVSKTKPSKADYLEKAESSGRSTGGKHSSSQFSAHHGAAQPSKKISTIEGTSSKPLKGVSMNRPESKSPASSYSFTSTSTKRRDADGQLNCSHSGNSDSRKRKRTASTSRQLANAAKKPRR